MARAMSTSDERIGNDLAPRSDRLLTCTAQRAGVMNNIQTSRAPSSRPAGVMNNLASCPPNRR